jgi:hypothetical protein
MADIRIKDLTTEAPTSLTGDFLPIDGGTGTRKLSAFNPTFGGNATVGGTLAVTGEATFSSNAILNGSTAAPYFHIRGANANASPIIYLTSGFGGGSQQIWSIYTNEGSAGGFLVRDNTTGTNPLTIAKTSGVVSIPSTTASTSTSSGALVVGNGTSGGLGVGGAANIGGNITVGGANVTQGALASLPAGAYLSAETSSGEGYLTSYNGTSAAYLPINYRSSEHKFTSNGAVKVQSTTASTSTSSGALVVSGGVGVAGSINAGAGGSTHIFTGGDGGSGSTLFALKDLGGTTRVNVSGTGEVGIGVNLVLTGSSNVFRINNAQTPASATATGTAGTICWDTSYIYVCTATNTWKRVAISTW